MFIKISYLFIFLSIFAFALGNNLSKNSDYLRFEPILKDSTFNIPELKLFDNPNFSGKPLIELNSAGLIVEGKIVCSLNKENPSKLKNLKSSELPCKDYLPVHSEHFDSLGPEVFLVVYVEGPGTSKYYETKFKGKKLYIDKANLGSFSFSLSQEKTEELKWSESNKSFQELLKEDQLLAEYIKSLNICFEKKDRSCLSVNQADYTTLIRQLLYEICQPDQSDLSLNPANDLYGKHCPSPASLGFNSEGEKVDPNSLHRSKETIAGDKNKMKEFENVFWLHYQGCFHSSDPAKYEGMRFVLEKKEQPLQVEVYEHNKRKVNCSIYKLKDKQNNFFWTLINPN